jgi:SAM-dependent methyltransferase
MTVDLRDTLETVRRIEDGGPPLATAIHPEDGMFQCVLDQDGTPDNPQSQYFAGGERMLAGLRDMLAQLDVELEDTPRLLEFACGHGHFTRHLVRVLDPSRITVCDLHHAAVDFQVDTFGVTGVYSPPAPEDLVFPERYDLVFAASLFGHLPDASFGRWLGRLYDALDDGGTLVFSTHGPGCLPGDQAFPEGGLVHQAASEGRTRPADDRGTTYVTPAFVADVVRERTGQDLALEVERGLFPTQDVYAVRKPAATPSRNHRDARARG